MAERENEKLTQEEVKGQMLLNEADILEGLLDAADMTKETKTIEIVRGGRTLITFRIRALSEDEYNRCKKKHTTYKRNKQLGIKMPDEVNTSAYRCALIYTATLEEDRKKMWDNKELWKALGTKGIEIVTGLNVIETCLRAGEKDRDIAAIDGLSGFSDGDDGEDEESQSMEETAKN